MNTQATTVETRGLGNEVCYNTGYTDPKQYRPLTQEEVQIHSTLEDKVAALEKQRDRLQAQLFSHIKKKFIREENLNEVRQEIILPEELPTDAEWIDYLTGELMYHTLAQHQSRHDHNIEKERQHELAEMRSRLAITALNNQNQRGDLVIYFASKVKTAAEKDLADSSKDGPFMQLFKARVDLANRMVNAMKERFAKK